MRIRETENNQHWINSFDNNENILLKTMRYMDIIMLGWYYDLER